LTVGGLVADEKPSRSYEPQDRLTRMANAVLSAAEAHPEWRAGDKVIAFLNDRERGGIAIGGYDDDLDALVDLFLHLRAMFAAHGKELSLVGLGAKTGRG
jgi:hypothetical protein